MWKAVFMAALVAMPVAAQSPQCGVRSEVIAALADGFGEARHMQGITRDGVLMEVFGNAQTGTWTVTVTTAQGVMCVVSEGEAFGLLDEAPQGMTF